MGKIGKIKIGDKEVWPFTIPSGIVMTSVATGSRLLREIEEIGIWTTKSIGPEARAGNREPILYQYAPGCWGNAVGLTNPGAEEFAKELERARNRFDISRDKFVLGSIFGKNIDEFVYVLDTLEKIVDGFELNLSCPHCSQVGMALGQDPEIVEDIISILSSRTRKPIIAKLTPNARNIGEIAKTAMAAGAYGISAINTLGPELYVLEDGTPILTNGLGGMSGMGIKPSGLRCVRDIRKEIGDKALIIGMGGIRTARDVEEYRALGANVFGIGSALAGMDDKDIKFYFSHLHGDLEYGTNYASSDLKKVDTSYKKVRVDKVKKNACDLSTIVTDTDIESLPGQFVFAFIKKIGEKPFSVMDDSPLTLGVLNRGEVSKALTELKSGDEFYVRGPYGKPTGRGGYTTLVGGGCGIAGLHLLAKKYNDGKYSENLKIFLGGKDGEHLLADNELSRYGEVYVATEDGSVGERGLVTDLLRGKIKEGRLVPGTHFYNCGPRAMIDAVVPLELTLSGANQVFSSLDYTTKCGEGLCGSCADSKGRRTCKEGPFMPAD